MTAPAGISSAVAASRPQPADQIQALAPMKNNAERAKTAHTPRLSQRDMKPTITPNFALARGLSA